MPPLTRTPFCTDQHGGLSLAGQFEPGADAPVLILGNLMRPNCAAPATASKASPSMIGIAAALFGFLPSGGLLPWLASAILRSRC